MYTVVGYDKDNDVYIKYATYSVEIFAYMKADELFSEVKRGDLRRKDNGEPIDWIIIYENYGDPDEKVIKTYM